MKYLEFDTPASKQAGDLASDFKLRNHGLKHLDRVYWNLPAFGADRRGHLPQRGAPRPRRRRSWSTPASGPPARRMTSTSCGSRSTEDTDLVGRVQPAGQPGEIQRVCSARLQAFLQGEELFVQDCYVGADPEYRMPIRIITDQGLAEPLRAQHVHHRPPTRTNSSGHVSRVHGDRRARLQGATRASTAPAPTPRIMLNFARGWR